MTRDPRTVYLELLVLRCRQGERAAHEELIAAWEGRLLYFIRRLVDEPQDAYDVLQQTWIKVLRGIGGLKDARRLPAWLYRVARNAALNHGRLQATYRAAVARESLQSGARVEDRRPLLDDVEQVHFGLQQLTLPHREVLTLFFLDNLSVHEIADVVDAPPGTVKSRLHYAKQALRDVLSRDEAGPGPLPTPTRALT